MNRLLLSLLHGILIRHLFVALTTLWVMIVTTVTLVHPVVVCANVCGHYYDTRLSHQTRLFDLVTVGGEIVAASSAMKVRQVRKKVVASGRCSRKR